MEDRNKLITDLLNGTCLSFKNLVPIHHEIKKPRLVKHSLQLQFGILIGITVDIKGKLILSGDSAIFGVIGESMFGMPLEGEMLLSFSGEFGNMIAGSLSTNLVNNGIHTDISTPTIIQANTTLSGFTNALQITAVFEEERKMDIYFLLD